MTVIQFRFRKAARPVKKSAMATLKIGFLGAGKMATALAKGFVNTKLAVAKDIIGSDPYDAARKHFTDETGAKATTSNADVVKFADILIVATKPDQIAAALDEIHSQLKSKKD